MTNYDLTHLDPQTFQQLVNMLALRELGAGVSSFSPGADGGRDGLYEGSAPYPSSTENWEGVWYIQSKFHRLKASTNEQKWLVNEVRKEIKDFEHGERVWPNIWIVATNVDPSAVPGTGTHDTLKAELANINPDLATRFHIWGGTKILGLLSKYPDVADYYSHFITPGHVIASIYKSLVTKDARLLDIVRELTVAGLDDYSQTKLDQAGSTSDNRPGIEAVYTDLPYESGWSEGQGMVAIDLALASALDHRKALVGPSEAEWAAWHGHPRRSRVWFMKGGPGQGKSTSTQFISQVHRAAIILESEELAVTASQRSAALRIQARALRDDIWPRHPRIPVSVELREYAQWFGDQPSSASRRLLVYICDKLARSIGQNVEVGALKDALSKGRWLFVLDGLDEVPSDVKNEVAKEITYFVNNLLVGQQSDAQVVCTSRPQGYAGQFDSADFAVVELTKLDLEQALSCARPVLEIGRTREDFEKDYKILTEAANNPTVQEIMTTPLQSHIMAVVVRGGRKPPERKYQLFQNFYDVIRKREAARTLPDPRLAELLLRGDKLIKNLHSRLGFELHARAETSTGALTSLTKEEFRSVVHETVVSLRDSDIDETVSVLMEAATERLVLVNTPDNSSSVRFDIRPLQEFFAAEYIQEAFEPASLKERLFSLVTDSHWREVMHFYLSALVENDRKTDLAVAIDVLSEANAAANGDASRQLSLKIALGSNQAARLLAEGVLEQDKRDRQTFRSVLEPVAGCFDARALVGPVIPKYSRSWFVDLLIAACKERSSSESVGAFLLLSSIISDEDPRGRVVEELLMSAPGDIRTYVLSEIAAHMSSYPVPSVSRWVQRVAVRALRSPDWISSPKSVVGSALSILGSASEEGGALALGWPEEISGLLGTLVSSNQRASREVVSELVGGVLRYARWPSTLYRDSHKWSAKQLDLLSQQGGYFSAAALMIRARRDIASAKVEAAEWLTEHKSLLALVPYPLHALMPSESLKALCGDGPVDPDVISRLPDPQNVSISLAYTANCDWSVLFRSPVNLVEHVIIYQQGHALGHSLIDYLADDDGASDFIRLVESGKLDTVVGHARQFLDGTDADRPDIKAALVARAGRKEQWWGNHRFGRGFKLELPGEAALLPAYVGLLTFTRAEFLDGRFGRRETRYAQGQIEERTEAELDVYETTLDAISSDTDQPTPVRCAALLAAALASGNATTARTKVRSSLDLVPGNREPWVVVGALLALTPAIMSHDEDAWELASQIVDRERDNVEVRRAMLPLIARWRERSGAPVQAGGWLSSFPGEAA